MEAEALVLAPQPAVSPPAASPDKKALAAAPTSALKTRATRRKTLCDITNLSRREPAEVPNESACPAPEKLAQLVKENADLVSLIAERDEIIQLSGTEIQKLRLANWELARTNSQMMAELNLGRNKLKALQHELACSRAALKAKTSELEDVKKAMQRRNIHTQRTQHLGPDKVAQTKDGDVVDPEPASEATRAGSIQRSGNASRKRMLRSRSLGPAASTKLALPKDKETSQRRKSMRVPQPSASSEDLFEIEDVEVAIGSCKIDPDTASGSERAGHQFQRRSSLGRPLRQARERVTSYKEMPLHVKLRRP
ncbi:hypothetical protein PAHAL_9G230400 [Panicum hallii]|uniref:Shugoshin C-terminal domain-containing protein n=1 Tax=Panicum hallii TaxID=206008 RepID=A0A2S3ILR3_9POAL|nr:shugoshin-1 [Panicum hallii]PAN47051.1 hypothetical protein PAHAL_9G230400 [Panicum hallii]